ncbi:uncharacterized protein LOC143451748 isoform X2 [Clavelina lepadiformis]|uniref:uncharacterized protein LOC143451748 isoform X2 n=1 Tax=Clavelina lepadiformis TaxID=159417 RepID=UPI0040435F72
MWCIEGGSSPDWYLERMDIRDLETNECRFFLCGTKFSDVLEDTVRAATLEELQTRLVFHLRQRPWQHYLMTRVERVATCSLFMFMVMLTSIMFHGHSYAMDGKC